MTTSEGDTNTNDHPSTMPSGVLSDVSAYSPYLPSTVVPEGTDCGLVNPWIEINTRHLAWNVSRILARVGETPIMAVVECNAYGHGTVGIARYLQQEGIHRFATVRVGEAVALRADGIKGMILNLGTFSPLEAERLLRHHISQSVFSEEVDRLAKAAQRVSTRAKVHIEVDTGLSRVGVPYAQALPFIERVAEMPGMAIEGIFTALTEEADFDAIQVQRLQQVCQEATLRGISVGIRHAASSSAVGRLPAAFLDMVRPGGCFFGFGPQPDLNLKPVMSLKTRVALVKKVQPGDTISYHRRGRVERETLLAILPIGYFDGYPHQAVDRAEVLIRGQRWPLIVYMSANHATVDITESRGIQIGDEALLFGAQGGNSISLEEVAKWADSTTYKVATGMRPFLPRIYLT